MFQKSETDIIMIST